MSRTVNDSGLSADLPVSNITPRRITGVRSGVNRIGQPAASTLAPAGVLGHWSRPSSTPSPSASTGQPFELTRAPAGVPGHWSSPSYTPSRSESDGQPRASVVAPTGVSGHASRRSGTPSWSASAGGPLRVKTDKPSEPTTWPAQSPPANPVLG